MNFFFVWNCFWQNWFCQAAALGTRELGNPWERSDFYSGTAAAERVLLLLRISELSSFLKKGCKNYNYIILNIIVNFFYKNDLRCDIFEKEK